MTTVTLPREVVQALRRAYSLGQTYWQQADSESYSQNRKSGATAAKFNQLVVDTCAALDAPAQPVDCVGCTRMGFCGNRFDDEPRYENCTNGDKFKPLPTIQLYKVTK